MKNDLRLIGPFSQMLTLAGLPSHGAINDQRLNPISDAAILVSEGRISEVGSFDYLQKKWNKVTIEEVDERLVVLPGFIDAHTHLCYGGSRANDFAKRISGQTYQQIAKSGGGIWQTVTDTRKATSQALKDSLLERTSIKLKGGVTTIEVKSGYGLSVEHELRILRCIFKTSNQTPIDIIATCLAAHICPHDFDGSADQYLSLLLDELLPIIKSEKLSNRIDIFIEDGAFSSNAALKFLGQAKAMQFDIVIHADQFNVAGSLVAAQLGALSADHLEVSQKKEITELVKAGVICTALPGASIGLGGDFAPARDILNEHGCLVIASDQNPGSAPHGDLLTLASILATYQKLSTAETFAAMTYRAATALKLTDRGTIAPASKADFIGFSTNDFREILYNQGNLKPSHIWKGGLRQSFPF